jgi:hypothetical protein
MTSHTGDTESHMSTCTPTLSQWSTLDVFHVIAGLVLRQGYVPEIRTQNSHLKQRIFWG